MAKTKVTKNVPAVRKSGAVATWKDQIKQSVQDRKAVSVQLPGAGGDFMSFKGGNISVGGMPQANPVPVVILKTANDRSYFANDYRPGVAASPDCYSLDLKKPHPEAPDPQSTLCATCDKNKFGSARQGNGKACKEGVKFAMIHADALENDNVEAAPIVQGKLSVLNTKIWKEFEGANFTDEEALWQYVIAIHNQADTRTIYRVDFARSPILDEALVGQLAARENEAKELLAQAYPELTPGNEAAAPARDPGRKRKF